MGITGLLPLLEAATEKCSIAKFRGGTVAVDTYCWLHRGANSCAEQLMRGEDASGYVHYCLKFVKMLVSYNIHVIMVFDGKNLPAKKETEAKRREQRTTAKRRAAELLRLGQTGQARQLMRQAIDITPEMAHKLIEACREIKNVDCIVAPYESDAQLTFFSLRDIADCIITEDSDLILFGCKKVMFKMDLFGVGHLISQENINKALKMRPDVFSFDKFRHMCILSGCDYLSSLAGIGLKKSLKFLSLTHETDPLKFIKKLPRYLALKELSVPDDYIENFMVAEATLKHQTVFDPFLKKLIPLTNPEESGTNPKYCINSGERYNDKIALEVAMGNRHPSNFKVFSNWTPPVELLPSRSIWAANYIKQMTRESNKKMLSNKEPKMKNIVEPIYEVYEIENREEDDETKEMLDSYRNAKVETIVETEVPEKVLEKTESPILNKKPNPFLKKKTKLSKFNSVEVSKTHITKSRFFIKSLTQPETGTSDSDMCTAESDDILKNEDNDISKEEDKCNIEIEADVVVINSTSNNNVENISSSINTASNTTAKIPPVLAKPMETKKRKLGPCKSLGLSKKQRSLHEFFAKK